MLGFSCRCQGSQQLERGSARFSYKSKCSALKRMEISFNCSLWCKRGLKFQLNMGRVVVIPSFLSVLYNIKLFGFILKNRNSQDPSPRGNWIPEQPPRRLLSPDQTIHCPGPRRYPAGLPIRWRRPPHNSPHHPLLLGDASLVTALCGLSPGGRGAARFRPWIRTNKDSINLFHPFSMLFHQSQARHHGGKVLQSEIGICTLQRILATSKGPGRFSINRRISFPFIWSQYHLLNLDLGLICPSLDFDRGRCRSSICPLSA